MYIKVNNSSQVINMDDYVLINDLAFHMRRIELSALKDGDNYYTKDEVQELVKGQLDVDSFVTENNLIDILKSYVTGFTMFYMQTDDAENEPDVNDASWAESITNWLPNKYMWQMVEINKPGLIVRSTPVCISGPAEEEEEEVINRLIEVRPQWCLNNDGNWNYELISLPTEFDEVWMRNELIWDDGFTTNTESVKDQVFEKVKELQARIIQYEEDITTIKEELELRATKEELQEVIDYDNSNLLKNGDFYYGTKYWTMYGTGVAIPRLQSKPEFPHGNAFVIQGEYSHVQYIEQPTYPITNTEESIYTLSCMVQSDDAQDGYDMPLYGLKIEVHYPDKSIEEFIKEVEITDGTWNKLHLTIELNRVVEHFECNFYVRDTGKTIRVSEMMFTQGKIVGPFSPSQKEVFDNIYELLENMNDNANIDLSNYALIEDIPVKLSELENDMDYLVEVPEEYITEDELNNKNYLTEHQDISHLALKEDIPSIDDLATEEFVKKEIEKLRAIIYVADMPTGNVDVDTAMLQSLLDKANDNINIHIKIPEAEYTIKTLYIKSNTTIEMTNKTILRYSDTFINDKKLPILLMNAKAFEDEFLEYNGNGNITIKGGIIYAPSAMCLIHGKDIFIDGITFKNSETDHVMQIGGCKNIHIENCNFIGRKQAADDRSYTEMIQIDWVTVSGMPYWDETSTIFDHTVNDNVIIENCNFDVGEGDYAFLCTGIGSHSSDGDYKNKNIIIQNCNFNNFMYAGIVASKMENVIIRDNIFNTNVVTDSIQVKESNNAIIENNIINNSKRLSYITNSLNVKIINNTIKNSAGGPSIIAIADSNELIINNNIFNNCLCTQAIMMLKGCSYLSVANNIDNNCVSDIDLFIHLYDSDNNLSSIGIVKNNITLMTEVSFGDGVSKIINNCIGEVLWSGEIGVGETLTLNDDINKFEGLVITLQCYGQIKRNLIFTTGTSIFREFNVADNQLIVIDFTLSLNENTITFESEQCILFTEGTITSHNYQVKIKNIAGYRKQI